MIQLKLKLNSKKPTTVYAVNGKTYVLKPGSNVLDLEYNDYISLAKALGIKPIENKKEDAPAPVKEAPKPVVENKPIVEEKPVAKDKPAPVEEPVREEASAEEVKDEPAEENHEEAPVEETAEEVASEEAPAEEPVKEEVDYSTWTLKQLKAEYKEITGETCKLKKDEVIAFLQEHRSNA